MTVLAIDGPGGAGKTTVACAVARRLGGCRLDTGALYRAVTLAVLRAGIDPADGPGCERVAREVVVSVVDTRVLLDGEDVSAEIRSAEVTGAVSDVSAHTPVRDLLREEQRHIAAEGLWVVEGRDIGTVVFPEAPLKVYLDASPAERARRRASEVGRPDVELVEAEIRSRDSLDSNRTDSPLRPAADAVTLDTSDLTVDEVTDRIAALWQRAVGGESEEAT